MPTQQWPKEYKTTEAFRALVQIEQKYLLQQSNPYLQLGVASSENITWSSLFLSSVIHHNIGHLFGNMILFLFLATWVEQKIRAVSTLLLFFSGSFAGFLWQVNGVPIVPTYGASAGVYAIMGAFFVFFYRTHLSVLFFYFFYFKKILLPATFYFPVIFFYNDLIHLALDSSTGVAHRAHLGGLLVGMLYAWLIKKKEHLHPDQFFSEEKILVQKIKTAKSFQECWEPFFELMKWNVQNHQGLKDFLIKWRDFKAPITSQQKKFIEKKLKIYFHLAAHKNEFSMITGLLKLIPSAISLPVIFKDISLKKILLLADRLSKQKEWSGAKRLYLLALTHKLSQFMKTKISQTLSEIDNQEREIEIGDKV
jgi:membrane associated rhomboid family serine protease